MNLLINRNIVWCDLFVDRLAQLGVKYACISPGSRSTPLTISFAANKKIKTFPIVDERSSGFFALGIAKQTNTPVVLVTTSGTAVAELYPAIIEAYYQRVPLIICTADRPSTLQNSGANQTINQFNIYKNQIRYYINAGLPDINKLDSIIKIAEDAFNIALKTDKGPVHINLPFDKPFEPNNFTDKIYVKKLEKAYCFVPSQKQPSIPKVNFKIVVDKLAKTERGLIFVGYGNFDKHFASKVSQLSKKYSYPVFVDGASTLRFGTHSKENFIENLTTIVRAKNFLKEFDPDLIIQFGGAPTSNVLLEFFKQSKAEKILVNEFGDKHDPSLTSKKVLRIDSNDFCDALLNKEIKKQNNKNWLNAFKQLNKIAEKEKSKQITNAQFPFEGRILSEIINSIPENSNIMISNSMPIRDFDYFVSSSSKKINIYTNRGASGIDGITSTALGIASASKKATYLITGDLAFFHDLTGIHNSIKYDIPLTVILINNNGGGIFESLPISAYKNYLNKYFKTPLNLNFAKIVNSLGGKLISIKNWNMLKRKLLYSGKGKKFVVLEIKTNASESKSIRLLFWKKTANKLFKLIDEINC